MKKYLIIIPAIILTSCYACAQQSEKTKVLDRTDYAQKTEGKKVVIIDVRTPQEFAAGHIEGAININVKSIDFNEKIENMDKDQPVYIYCQSGNRSRTAAQKLRKAGFTEIYDLKGGFVLWNGKVVK